MSGGLFELNTELNTVNLSGLGISVNTFWTDLGNSVGNGLNNLVSELKNLSLWLDNKRDVNTGSLSNLNTTI